MPEVPNPPSSMTYTEYRSERIKDYPGLFFNHLEAKPKTKFDYHEDEDAHPPLTEDEV